jgi:DNA-binding response OmpR family regulator
LSLFFLRKSPYRNGSFHGLFTYLLYGLSIMESILTVADNGERWLLVAMFERAGYLPIEAREGGDAVRELLDRNPDAIVMAEETPPVEGVDTLSLLRRLTAAPIVVIGRGGETNISRALLQGADAYVTRPLDGEHLRARIRALLRRRRPKAPSAPSEGQSQSYSHGGLPDRFSHLTPVEGRLLQCLLSKDGGVTSREELSVSVWGERKKDLSLRFYISRLRRKLAEVAAWEIRTLRGRGYLLNMGGAGPRPKEER